MRFSALKKSGPIEALELLRGICCEFVVFSALKKSGPIEAWHWAPVEARPGPGSPL